jgi:ADP-heptose:LPS heptosyltransferase
MISRLIRWLLRQIFGNEFDRLLGRAAKRGHQRFLIYWNRGLGDIALGLYTLFQRIRTFIPNAEITVITRKDLAEPFELLESIKTIVDPQLTRGRSSPREVFRRLDVKRKDFDIVLDDPDPTEWLSWQLGTVTPRLKWKPEYDALCEKFALRKNNEICIAVHVNSETNQYYGYAKNWPTDHWRKLFDQIETRHSVRFVLFGFAQPNAFSSPIVTDLRGKTSVLEMISIIKNHCSVLIAPDSGILAMVYYLDCVFPITVISLWSDPRQGVLKQAVSSPNSGLRHYPLIGENEDVTRIRITEVVRIVERTLKERQTTEPSLTEQPKSSA